MFIKNKSFILAALLGVSSAAFAAGTALPEGGNITPVECDILGEAVKVNLSNNVKGTFSCSEANNSADFGACHTSGSRSTTLKCAKVGVDAEGDDIWNHTGCESEPESGTVSLDAPGYKGFRASTTGGSVGEIQLGTNCTDASVLTLLP